MERGLDAAEGRAGEDETHDDVFFGQCARGGAARGAEGSRGIAWGGARGGYEREPAPKPEAWPALAEMLLRVCELTIAVSVPTSAAFSLQKPDSHELHAVLTYTLAN